MTSPWFRSRKPLPHRSLPSHEVFAPGPLRPDQLCCGRPWGRGRLGARRPGNRRRLSLFDLGPALLFPRKRAAGSLAAAPAACGFFLVGLGQWFFRASASPYNTRIELSLLLASLIFLFLCVQAFRTLHDWRSFVWFGMGLGFVVSVFGILQHLTFNGKLYWFRELRYGGIPFGPYVNRNHFAGLMELVLPLALVPLVLGRVRRERLAIVALFAVMPIAALFLSASRGGIVSFCVQLALLTYLLLRRRGLGKHLLGVAAVLLAALLMVTWLGVGQILQRFSSFQSLEVTEGKRAAM